MARASACARVVLPTPGTPSMSRCPRARMLTSARRTTSSLPRITRRNAFSSSIALWDTAIAVSGDIGSILLSASEMEGVTDVTNLTSDLRLWTSAKLALSQNVIFIEACEGRLRGRLRSEVQSPKSDLLHKLRGSSGQALNALGNRGMRREQVPESHSTKERLDDK